MSLQEILIILLIHWLADFSLQTHSQALGKSKSFEPLFEHVVVYSLVWLLAAYFLLGNWDKAAVFAIVTFICHFVTDLITSRIARGFFDKGDTHNGFTVVGFDLILHYLQLFLTFETLK